jgi:acyl-CoA dehydrogenase
MEISTYQEYFGDIHQEVRMATRRFVEKEILPNIEQWEEEGDIPRELYKKAGNVGILGAGFPEEYGGTGGDIFLTIAVNEEMMRSGSGGLVASIGSIGIAIPPILAMASEEQKHRFVPPVIAGEKISALGITEPSGGSDVANLQTTAVREGDCYVVNGSKTFITNGGKADQLTVAVRTGGEGAHGISLLVIDSHTPGVSTSTSFKKMGWWASNTAQIFFDNVRRWKT